MQRTNNTRAGFTLIEILAVLVILSILMTFLISRVMTSDDIFRGENTRQFLAQVDAAIAEYNQEFGDYPPSVFEGDAVKNQVNLGGERLVVALFQKKWVGPELPEDRLTNTDEDSSRESLTSFTSKELFELGDDWQNPIAYFHRRDYDKKHTYQTVDPETGELYETIVEALKNPRTGDPWQRRKYQLISAGIDGLFGTEDDITNFSRE